MQIIRLALVMGWNVLTPLVGVAICLAEDMLRFDGPWMGTLAIWIAGLEI
jgi:hypothetical protein